MSLKSKHTTTAHRPRCPHLNLLVVSCDRLVVLPQETQDKKACQGGVYLHRPTTPRAGKKGGKKSQEKSQVDGPEALKEPSSTLLDYNDVWHYAQKTGKLRIFIRKIGFDPFIPYFFSAAKRISKPVPRQMGRECKNAE